MLISKSRSIYLHQQLGCLFDEESSIGHILCRAQANLSFLFACSDEIWRYISRPRWLRWIPALWTRMSIDPCKSSSTGPGVRKQIICAARMRLSVVAPIVENASIGLLLKVCRPPAQELVYFPLSIIAKCSRLSTLSNINIGAYLEISFRRTTVRQHSWMPGQAVKNWWQDWVDADLAIPDGIF